jgi:hypothetical protein
MYAERLSFEREIEDLGLETSSPSAQVILVAGFDYEQNGVSFEGICQNRKARLLKKDPSLKITLCDFESGEMRSSEVDSKGKRSWKLVKSFTPITSANYTSIGGRKRFNKNQAGTMSITDIYQLVQDIGKNEPSSLVELSFFSHGWMGGPILVNSDDPNPNHPFRDPNDKDARIFKDFQSPNMMSSAKDNFKKAFSTTGFTWVWGCAFADIFHQVIHRVVNNATYKKAKLAKIKDSEAFSFDFDQRWADQNYGIFPSFFPPPGMSGKFPQKFNRTFKQITEFFSEGRENTYCRVIAKVSKVKCRGALLGTYSDYEKDVKLPLMVVPHRGLKFKGKYPYSDDFSSYIKFYRTYMKSSLDPEGRGYGIYSP